MTQKPFPESRALTPYVSRYRAHLCAQRYSESTQHSYQRCVLHFVRWTDQARIQPRQIDEDTLQEFLGRHLGHCECEFVVRRSVHENRAALHHFLKVLRPGRPISGNADRIGRELTEFDRYMDQTCGLARNTRYQRAGIVRRFLTAEFGTRPIDLSRVTPVMP